MHSLISSLLFLQSDTEFWDKMQAEWEELARRNWLTENEQAQIPPSVSPHEKVTTVAAPAMSKKLIFANCVAMETMIVYSLKI